MKDLYNMVRNGDDMYRKRMEYRRNRDDCLYTPGIIVFRHPPEMVASAFETVLEQYGPYFETVEFAMGHNSRDGDNYRAFSEIRDIIIV